MGRFFSGGRLLVFLGGIIVLVILAGASLRAREAVLPWPAKFVLDVTSPISGWLNTPANDVQTFFRRFHDLQTMYQENSSLQNLANEVSLMKVQVAELDQENANLKQMLNYQGRAAQFKLIAGQVTGRSPLAWNSTMTLSVGSLAGVARGMPVISQSGALIGRIESVAEFSSTAVLLTSSQTTDGVSANIISGKQTQFGIVSGSLGNSSLLTMQFISELSGGARPGDLVVTSGLSDMYPRGILIGRVKQFISDGSGITHSALVTPAADLNYLNYVFVLAPKPWQVIP